MEQLRRVSIVVAIVAFAVAIVSGTMIFFLFEAPFLVTVFVAAGAIAIGCFMLAAIAAYFER